MCRADLQTGPQKPDGRPDLASQGIHCRQMMRNFAVAGATCVIVTEQICAGWCSLCEYCRAMEV